MEPARKREGSRTEPEFAEKDLFRSEIRSGGGPKVSDDVQTSDSMAEETPFTTESQDRKNIAVASILMVAITVCLFFLPAVNGLIAGTVGGYIVGGVKRAVLVALLPAFIIAGGLWILLATIQFRVVGILEGPALGFHITFSELGLFLGAATGGAIAHNKIDRFNRA